MNAKDIRAKTDADLKKDIIAKRESLRSFRFGIAGSKTRSVREGRSIRKDIARILGELNTRRK